MKSIVLLRRLYEIETVLALDGQPLSYNAYAGHNFDLMVNPTDGFWKIIKNQLKQRNKARQAALLTARKPDSNPRAPQFDSFTLIPFEVFAPASSEKTLSSSVNPVVISEAGPSQSDAQIAAPPLNVNIYNAPQANANTSNTYETAPTVGSVEKKVEANQEAAFQQIQDGQTPTGKNLKKTKK